MVDKKYKYLEPEAKKAIDHCKKEDANLIMMIDGFLTDTEALHLRDLLWYARNKEVQVLFTPPFNKYGLAA